jgi:hypothetical protein
MNQFTKTETKKSREIVAGGKTPGGNCCGFTSVNLKKERENNFQPMFSSKFQDTFFQHMQINEHIAHVHCSHALQFQA